MSRALERVLTGAVLASAAVLIVLRFLAIDATSHSASDTLRPWLLESLIVGAVAVGAVILLGRVAAGRRR